MSNCYQTFLSTGPYLFWWFKIILLSLRFIWRYVDFVIKFCFLKRTKSFCCNCCCCCCLILLFVLTRFLNIGISQQFNASILLHWVVCFRGYLIVHTLFFKKYLGFFGLFGIPKKNFLGFLSIHNLVDNCAKFVDGRGRNLMCQRTLLSRLVHYTFLYSFSSLKQKCGK